MIYLLFSILSATTIYLAFKLANKFTVNTRVVISINYLIAVIAGIIKEGKLIPIQNIINSGWIFMAIIIGTLFVLMFFLIDYATRLVGISITSVATRLSMVLPILTSALFFDASNSLFKIIILTTTILASLLSIYKKPLKKFRFKYFLLPIVLFIGSGFVDSLIKVAQHLYIPQHEVSLFSSSLFFISFFISLIFTFSKSKSLSSINAPTIYLGSLLGVANFGSLYFLINALHSNFIDSALIFGINNVGVVILSLILGSVFFNEKISKLNKAGIVLASICIIIFAKFNGSF